MNHFIILQFRSMPESPRSLFFEGRGRNTSVEVEHSAGPHWYDLVRVVLPDLAASLDLPPPCLAGDLSFEVNEHGVLQAVSTQVRWEGAREDLLTLRLVDYRAICANKLNGTALLPPRGCYYPIYSNSNGRRP